MTNFAEELAYWYLRLQGFFPLRNWVAHPEEERRQNADADLIAIRLPGAYEVVGGQPTEAERRRFEEWEIDLAADTVALLVEVKGGRQRANVRAGAERAFEPPRVRAAIRRIGLWTLEETDAVAAALGHDAIFRDGHRVAATLLISADPPRRRPRTPYLHLRLTDAATFVTETMHRHLDVKAPARHFFPSELLQFMIWQIETGAARPY